MKIEKLGGEFAMIDQLSAIVPNAHGDLVAGIGDDAAVIRTAPEPAPYLLVTTDILVEERHFRRQWAEPEQIGIKAAESNLSDIAAMGGKPTWMFISLVLAKDADMPWARRLYEGIGASCRRHGAIVAGGDTAKGAVTTINITLLGMVSPAHLCLRSHARPGDLLMVTGPLGASAAALALLTRGESVCDDLLEKHLTPTCRLDAAASIAPLANAMIDISDGLGSELHHICQRSRVSAEIYAESIPLCEAVKAAGEILQMAPGDFAIQGGEDYELLFSIGKENITDLKKTGITCYRVGSIFEGDAPPVLVSAEGRHPLKCGYNHFA